VKGNPLASAVPTGWVLVQEVSAIAVLQNNVFMGDVLIELAKEVSFVSNVVGKRGARGLYLEEVARANITSNTISAVAGNCIGVFRGEVSFHGNSVVGCQDNGIAISSEVTSAVIRNNTIANNSNYGIAVGVNDVPRVGSARDPRLVLSDNTLTGNSAGPFFTEAATPLRPPSYVWQSRIRLTSKSGRRLCLRPPWCRSTEATAVGTIWKHNQLVS